MMARQVIDALARRGSGPSQTGGPSGQPPEMAQHVLSSRMNELQGADPGAILRKFTQMKQEVIEILPHVAFSLPGVSKHITTIWKGLDGAIKEAEQALSTQNAVQSQPLGFGAANPPNADEGGAPRGGSPFMPGGGS